MTDLWNSIGRMVRTLMNEHTAPRGSTIYDQALEITQRCQCQDLNMHRQHGMHCDGWWGSDIGSPEACCFCGEAEGGEHDRFHLGVPCYRDQLT